MSITDEKEVDCSLWHFQVEPFTYNELKETEITFNQVFNTLSEQPTSVSVLSNEKRSPRAPPAQI